MSQFVCYNIISFIYGGAAMSVSYNKLWKLMIDKKMKKGELKELTGIGFSTIAKLNRDEYVSLEVLVKICKALNCDIGDIVEIVTDKS